MRKFRLTFCLVTMKINPNQKSRLKMYRKLKTTPKAMSRLSSIFVDFFLIYWLGHVYFDVVLSFNVVRLVFTCALLSEIGAPSVETTYKMS